MDVLYRRAYGSRHVPHNTFWIALREPAWTFMLASVTLTLLQRLDTVVFADYAATLPV